MKWLLVVAVAVCAFVVLAAPETTGSGANSIPKQGGVKKPPARAEPQVNDDVSPHGAPKHGSTLFGGFSTFKFDILMQWNGTNDLYQTVLAPLAGQVLPDY